MQNKAIGITGLVGFVVFGLPAIGLMVMANALTYDYLPLGVGLTFVGVISLVMFTVSFVKEPK